MGSDSVNAQLTVMFAPSRLQKMYRLILFARLGKDFCSNETSDICSAVRCLTHVTRDKHQCCNYYFFILYYELHGTSY